MYNFNVDEILLQDSCLFYFWLKSFEFPKNDVCTVSFNSSFGNFSHSQCTEKFLKLFFAEIFFVVFFLLSFVSSFLVSIYAENKFDFYSIHTNSILNKILVQPILRYGFHGSIIFE